MRHKGGQRRALFSLPWFPYNPMLRSPDTNITDHSWVKEVVWLRDLHSWESSPLSSTSELLGARAILDDQEKQQDWEQLPH